MIEPPEHGRKRGGILRQQKTTEWRDILKSIPSPTRPAAIASNRHVAQTAKVRTRCDARRSPASSLNTRLCRDRCRTSRRRCPSFSHRVETPHACWQVPATEVEQPSCNCISTIAESFECRAASLSGPRNLAPFTTRADFNSRGSMSDSERFVTR